MMKDFECDYYRWYGRTKRNFKEKLSEPLQLKYMRIFRKCQHSKGLIYLYYRLRLQNISHKTSIEIYLDTPVGKGFFIMHSGGVVVCAESVGEYVNINRGAVIGMETRGSRAGRPTIGNRVYIGSNAAVVGKISIGDDVLIAPNSHVNFDVPSHSIVLGNPGRIIPRQNATVNYIYNIME